MNVILANGLLFRKGKGFEMNEMVKVVYGFQNIKSIDLSKMISHFMKYRGLAVSYQPDDKTSPISYPSISIWLDDGEMIFTLKFSNCGRSSLSVEYITNMACGLIDAYLWERKVLVHK